MALSSQAKVKRQAPKRTRPIKLDARQLDAARQGGLLHTSLDEIALRLGVGARSLDRWLTNAAHPFTKAYRTGQADANAVVQKALLHSAGSGNIQAIIWYMKQFMGATDHPTTVVNVQNEAVAHAGQLTVTAEQKKRVADIFAYIRRTEFDRDLEDGGAGASSN